jgi:NAD(P)-dependent dehydrogenase (short-subunit alcohol dehydrogenase family)
VSATAERAAMIVTGASRGIGAAIVRELAGAGIDIAAAARSTADLDALAASLDGAPGRVVPISADVSQLQDLERIVDEATRAFGRLDGLVNNAGWLPPGHIASEGRPDVWDNVICTNLRAPWYLSLCAYPHLRVTGGAIVNVTSSAGLRPENGLSIYGISKAGVVMLTQCCAKEWARDGIRVTAVAPGLTDTEMGGPVLEYLKSRGKPVSPLGSLIDPIEVARLVRFIVQETGRNITGDVIRVDAGHLLYA